MKLSNSLLETLLKISIRTKLIIACLFIATMTLCLGGVSIYFMNYIGEQGYMVSAKLAPLGDAAMGINQSATRAHLLFEEIVAGDTTEEIQEVWDLLDDALWYSNAILNGGVKGDRRFYATEDAQVQERMGAVQVGIKRFIESAHKRHEIFLAIDEESVIVTENDPSAGSLSDQNFDQEFEDFVKKVDEVEVLIHDRMYKGILEFETARKQSLFWVKVISVMSLAIALFFSFVTGQAIARPVQMLSVAARKIAKGDLSVEIPNVRGEDEIGVLARSFEEMLAALQKTAILQEDSARLSAMIEHTTDNIMFADNDRNLIYMNPASMKSFRSLAHLLPCKPEEMIGMCIDNFHKDPESIRKFLEEPGNFPHKTKLALGDEVISQTVFAVFDNRGKRMGTMANWKLTTEEERLQKSINETSVLITVSSEDLSLSSQEMRKNAAQTTKQAENVAAISDNTNKNVQSVAAAAEQLYLTANDISKHVKNAQETTEKAVLMADAMNATIGKLNGTNMEIEKVIQVISAIAEETNLLALNAMIEAARAGKAGKGFAVVANEVKSLATETAKATEEIREQISGIQNNTKEAVESIDSISGIIKQNNETVMSIATAMEEQVMTIEGISQNMTEAAEGMGEVVREADAILNAALENKKGADNIEASARQFSIMSDHFVGLTNREPQAEKGPAEDSVEDIYGDVELF